MESLETGEPEALPANPGPADTAVNYRRPLRAARPILMACARCRGRTDAEWVKRMRALARQDAEEMVPRPDFPVFGVSSPRLEPAALAAYEQVNGSWTAVTLAYGPWDAAPGPYVAVKSERADPELAAARAGAPGRGPEAGLLRAIDAERDRLAASTGVDEDEPAGPPRYSREELPAGAALVARHGTVWAARLDRPMDRPADRPMDGAAEVTVTITGRGVGPEQVRLSPGQRPAAAVRGPQRDPGPAGGTPAAGAAAGPRAGRRGGGVPRAGRVRAGGARQDQGVRPAGRTPAPAAGELGAAAQRALAAGGQRAAAAQPERPRAPRTTS